MVSTSTVGTQLWRGKTIQKQAIQVAATSITPLILANMAIIIITISPKDSTCDTLIPWLKSSPKTTSALTSRRLTRSIAAFASPTTSSRPGSTRSARRLGLCTSRATSVTKTPSPFFKTASRPAISRSHPGRKRTRFRILQRYLGTKMPLTRPSATRWS